MQDKSLPFFIALCDSGRIYPLAGVLIGMISPRIIPPPAVKSILTMPIWHDGEAWPDLPRHPNTETIARLWSLGLGPQKDASVAVRSPFTSVSSFG